jgi:hypothetical protein
MFVDSSFCTLISSDAVYTRQVCSFEHTKSSLNTPLPFCINNTHYRQKQRDVFFDVSLFLVERSDKVPQCLGDVEGHFCSHLKAKGA